MNPRINVISLDFDGCLSNNTFQNADNSDIIAANHELLSKLAADTNDNFFQAGYLMDGSGRQDLRVEFNNSKPPSKKGRCFPALKKIEEHLNNISRKVKFKLDTYLLGDRDKHEYGGLFTQGLMDDYEKFIANSSKNFPDESKLMILYAQMHRMSKLHPNSEITFDFYDDKENVLEGLSQFFEANRDFMPPNVILRLHHYNGEVIDGKLVRTIGVINNIRNPASMTDRKYHQTIGKMVECAGFDYQKKNIGRMDDANYPPSEDQYPQPGKFGIIGSLNHPDRMARFREARAQLNTKKPEKKVKIM